MQQQLFVIHLNFWVVFYETHMNLSLYHKGFQQLPNLSHLSIYLLGNRMIRKRVSQEVGEPYWCIWVFLSLVSCSCYLPFGFGMVIRASIFGFCNPAVLNLAFGPFLTCNCPLQKHDSIRRSHDGERTRIGTEKPQFLPSVSVDSLEPWKIRSEDLFSTFIILS